MPIEIRELVIKLTIQDHTEQKEINSIDLVSLKTAIIKECTAKVLASIKIQSER